MFRIGHDVALYIGAAVLNARMIHMLSATDQIRNAIYGRYPLLYLMTWEELRALQLLEAFSTKLFGAESSIAIWNCVTGFSGAISDPQVRDPLSAIQKVTSSQEKGFVVLKDFSHFLEDPAVERAMRDAYYSLQGKDRYII